MSIGTTAWLPSTLTCTPQAHYIAHEPTPYCPTIPNHRLNGTVTRGKQGVTPVPPTCNFVARKVTPQHRSLRRTTPARHLNLRHGKWLHPLGGFFINIQPNV